MFLEISKCACGRVGATNRPYCHMSGTVKLYLKDTVVIKNQKFTVDS